MDPMKLVDLVLTQLFDNVCEDARLSRLWGFSLLIETPRQRLLFDTGSNGRMLLENARILGKDLGHLDTLFLSHSHWDHLGGLDSILELNPKIRLVVPDSLSPRLIADLRGLCGELVVVGAEPCEFVPGFFSSGTLPGDMPEQALMIPSPDGALVVTGCAHPGIERIAERAIEQTGQSIALLLGGFHLFEADEATLEKRVMRLQALPIEYVLPTHCTGQAASLRLRELLGDRCLPGGCGRTLRFAGQAKPRFEPTL
jgi:7,8-dihydropterin-6-yl-methyl-4-(beta-D-ribofuranosyl)aminobenzene 5'-phosphate synthase